MANITVPGMPSATQAALDDLLHIVQSGIDKNISLENLLISLSESIEASDGDSISVTSKNTEITIDVSTADASISLGSGAFIGQTVHIVADGNNIAQVTGGNGIYVNSIYITSNTGGAHLTWNGSQWDAVNEVTADYESGDYLVAMSSNGDLVYHANLEKDNGLTSGQAFSFPIPFQDIPYAIARINENLARDVYLYTTTTSAATIAVRQLNDGSTSADTVSFNMFVSGGKY